MKTSILLLSLVGLALAAIPSVSDDKQQKVDFIEMLYDGKL